MPASGNGIPKTVTATTTAVPAPAMAHQCGLTLSPANRPNSTRIGNAATKVERIQLCNGSYVWVQAMGHPWGVVRRVILHEKERVYEQWVYRNESFYLVQPANSPGGVGPSASHEISFGAGQMEGLRHA